MNEDFRDLLHSLLDTGARFLIVGAHALAAHGIPRATGDLDVWIAPDSANAERVWQALVRFGAPMQGPGMSQRDLETPGTVIQIGLPPRRVDIMTQATGLEFESAWSRRLTQRVGALDLPFLGRDDLVRNKHAVGRPQDLADLEALGSGRG